MTDTHTHINTRCDRKETVTLDVPPEEQLGRNSVLNSVIVTIPRGPIDIRKSSYEENAIRSLRIRDVLGDFGRAQKIKSTWARFLATHCVHICSHFFLLVGRCRYIYIYLSLSLACLSGTRAAFSWLRMAAIKSLLNAHETLTPLATAV